VKPPVFAYHAPATVDEATAILAELGTDGKVLAGGQSLVPLMNMRLASPAALVDITRVADLDRIGLDAHAVRVGAAVTHAKLLRTEAVAETIPLVAEALRLVAHPVIRNRGTAVGSVVHADPAAEMPAVLALLGGHVELVSATGRRQVPAAEFLLGPLESDVRTGEMAAAIVLPRPAPRTGAAFVELARRHGDYALVGVGATVSLDEHGRLGRARAVFIGVGPVPVVLELTDALVGQRVGGEAPDDSGARAGAFDATHPLDAHDAVAHARDAIEPEDDIHASADYRRHLAGVLLTRALARAAQRASDTHRAFGGEDR
jgi:aerobic carbon-monoxide dehydrogenase medium subunit